MSEAKTTDNGLTCACAPGYPRCPASVHRDLVPPSSKNDLDILGDLDYLIEIYPKIGRGLERAKKEIERLRADHGKAIADISAVMRIIVRAVSWLEVQQVANPSHKGQSILEEIQAWCAGTFSSEGDGYWEKEYTKLSGFYTRDGAMKLLEKYWPDIFKAIRTDVETSARRLHGIGYSHTLCGYGIREGGPEGELIATFKHEADALAYAKAGSPLKTTDNCIWTRLPDVKNPLELHPISYRIGCSGQKAIGSRPIYPDICPDCKKPVAIAPQENGKGDV